MSNIKKTLLILLVATSIPFLIGFIFQDYIRHDLTFILGLQEERKASTTTYDNGDYKYHPSSREIRSDYIETGHFYKDILEVYTNDSITDDIKKEIAETVNGEIIGEVNETMYGYGLLQLKVEGESIKQIREHMRKLNNVPKFKEHIGRMDYMFAHPPGKTIQDLS